MKTIFDQVQKIAKRLMSAGTVSAFNWQGSWTAPDNGLLVVTPQRQSGSTGGVGLYIKDATAGMYGAGALYIPSVPGGYHSTITIPVIKGHRYETEYSTGLDSTILAKFYTWGGYCIVSILSAISSFVRRWSHEQENRESACEVGQKSDFFNRDQAGNSKHITVLAGKRIRSASNKETGRNIRCDFKWDRFCEYVYLANRNKGQRHGSIVFKYEHSCKNDNSVCSVHSRRRIALISEGGCAA